jgi:capsular polysaccharide biosynthesis protein
MPNDQNTEEMEIDLKEIFLLLLSKWWIILLSGLILAGVVGTYNQFFVTPMYSSTTQLVIVGSTSTITSLTDLQIGSSLTKDYIMVVKSRPVVEKVIENLKLDMSYEQLLSRVQVTNEAETRILSISITDADPYMAKQIVDQFALVSKTRIAELMDIAEPGILSAGVVNENKVSPTTAKNAAIGGLLGIVLCMGVFIVRFLLDDTIKSSEDIEKYLGLTTLAILPYEEAGVEEQKRENAENKVKKRERQKIKKEGE